MGDVLNMTVARSYNFDFLKKLSFLDKELYDNVLDVEKNVYINYKDCAKAVRTTLEKFINIVIDKHQLSEELDAHLTSNGLQDDLNNRIKFVFDVKSLIEYDRVRIETYKGFKSMSYHTFLRSFGNAGSHSKIQIYWPKLNCDNCINAAETFFNLFKKFFYKDIENVDSLQFDKDRMCIGDYTIQSHQILPDGSDEFRGYSLIFDDEEDEIDKHVIIKKFDKNDNNNNFATREQKVFKLLKRKYPDIALPPSIEYLTDKNVSESSFYVVAYVFNTPVLDLNNESLKNIPYEGKKKICKDITSFIYDLHHCEERMSHRRLDYTCIKLCRYNNEFKPYITRFNFTKIDKDNIKTVGPNLKRSLENKNDNSEINKYIPDELNNILVLPEGDNDETFAFWCKADIFSLGVLFMDILSGCIQQKLSQLNRIDGLERNDIKLIETMTDEDPDCRPSIKEVYEYFQ